MTTPYNQYSDNLNKLRDQYNPYHSAGLQSLHDLMNRYSQGLDTPGFLEDQLASGYKESPYAKNQSQYLTNLMNQNAAATGSLGSSYSASNLGEMLHRLLSQDEQGYIDRGMSTYNRALGGEEGINTMGYNALGQQTALGQQAAAAQLKGRLSHEESLKDLLGRITGLAGDFLSGGTGGMGSLIGQLGKHFFGSDEDGGSPFLPPPANTPMG